MIRTSAAIIGAGPIGLEMAIALGRAGIDYLLFDAHQLGHTISWFAPETRFFSSAERLSIAGVPLQTPDQTKPTREQYLTYLRTVAQQFGVRINAYEPVANIEKRDGGFVLTTRPQRGEQRYHAERIILATGGMAGPRRLGIPGEDLPHVSPYLSDPHNCFGQRVLIVGGKNSAIEAAMRLHHAGAQVSLSYRRPAFDAAEVKYWLLPEINSLIGNGRIDGYFSTRPAAITPTGVVLVSADGESAASALAARRVEVPADFVRLLIGYVADTSLCTMLGVRLTDPSQAPVFNPETMETNIPGVYVAGTLTGGTQDRFRVFIENCHIHTQRIAAAIAGQKPPAATAPPAEVVQMPES